MKLSRIAMRQTKITFIQSPISGVNRKIGLSSITSMKKLACQTFEILATGIPQYPEEVCHRSNHIWPNDGRAWSTASLIRATERANHTKAIPTGRNMAVDGSQRGLTRNPTARTSSSTLHNTEHVAHPSNHWSVAMTVCHRRTPTNNRPLRVW